jgi:nucleoside-diphosphate-sugar epimerase
MLRLLLHRGRPDWVGRHPVDAVAVDLEQHDALVRGLEQADAVINMLRPDGNGWHEAAASRLIAAATAANVTRYVHVSSIDVYGSAGAERLDEDSPIEPQTPYEREHAAAEALALRSADRLDLGIVRLGAVFGVGGRNIVAFADAMRQAHPLVLSARRSLYGERRMHLISVEAVAHILFFLSTVRHRLGGRVYLAVDDDEPGNNFATIHDELADAFGRPRRHWLPQLPPALLKALLALRGRSNANPMRRFSSARLADLGFNHDRMFSERLHAYVKVLARERRGLNSKASISRVGPREGRRAQSEHPENANHAERADEHQRKEQ